MTSKSIFNGFLAFRGLTNGYENGYDAFMFDRQPSDAGLKSSFPSSPYVISSIDYFNEEMRIPLEVFLDENFDVFLLVAIKFFLSKITLSDNSWNSFDLNLTLFSKRIFSSLIKFPFFAVIKISLFFPLIENFGLTISDLLVGNSDNIGNDFSLLIRL